jgi:hypothetical protein
MKTAKDGPFPAASASDRANRVGLLDFAVANWLSGSLPNPSGKRATPRWDCWLIVRFIAVQ